MSNELLGCPFCGGTDIQDRGAPGHYSVECRCFRGGFETPLGARERWNTRAASPLPHGGSEWRPIEDALKDGRLYLLYCRVNGTTVGSWSESSQKWLRDSEDYWPVDPSHFQEIPEPPALPSPQGETR